jgi:hypothetical protein
MLGSKLEPGELENKRRGQGSELCKMAMTPVRVRVRVRVRGQDHVRGMQDCRDTGLFWWLADS